MNPEGSLGELQERLIAWDEAKRLNLGSGKDIREGYVNVDLRGGEVQADACKLPFREGSFEYVLAPHVLEHVEDLGGAMMEIHRVLTSRGKVRIYVPYGLRALYHPFHKNAFHLVTLNGFCFVNDASLEYGRFFRKLEAKISCYAFPFGYHVEKYGGWVFRVLVRLGVFDPPGRPGRMYGWRLPLTRRWEITFLLEKI